VAADLTDELERAIASDDGEIIKPLERDVSM
jgi:hypothetical protein